MPRAKQSNRVHTNGNSNRDRVWNGFVRCDLTTKDKDDFKMWDVGFEEAFRELSELLPHYKLSMTYNGKNSSYVASLTGTDADHPNHGWCLTAFAGTLDDAIRVLWFKHSVILLEGWESNQLRRDEGGIG